MKNITLKLQVGEINKVLTALGNMPYLQVHELVAKIQLQATPQLETAQNGANEQEMATVES